MVYIQITKPTVNCHDMNIVVMIKNDILLNMFLTDIWIVETLLMYLCTKFVQSNIIHYGNCKYYRNKSKVLSYSSFYLLLTNLQ